MCYPNCDFVLLLEQSGVHTRTREDGLNAKEVGKYWGDNKSKMHSTIEKENGLFNETHLIGQEQSMQFFEYEEGPFYLTPEE